MEILKYAGAALAGLCAILIIIFALVGKKPIKILLFNALLGFAAIAAVNLTSRFTGAHIPVNEWSTAGSGVFGIPAVCALLILQTFF